MTATITQGKAKLLICDYLRETGRKGVSSLMRDINRHARTKIFAQRTLEKWLIEKDRMLQDENWLIVLGFIESEAFKRLVPYVNEGSAERRLVQVADGLLALYSHQKQPSGVFVLPSKIRMDGQQAMQHLSGMWESAAENDGVDASVKTYCNVAPVTGKPYGKLAYFAYLNWKRASVTGLVIYLNTIEQSAYEYLHRFVVHAWRRKDPETASTMPGELGHLKDAEFQPQFAVSDEINRHFYKSAGEEADQRVALRRASEVDPSAAMFIDILMEDVLPHGYREA